MRNGSRGCWSVVGLCVLMFFLQPVFLTAADPAADQIQRLVRQLNDDDRSRRDEAEKALIALAPAGDTAAIDALLDALPVPNEGIPAEARQRLQRLRQKIELQQANQAVDASRLTLTANAKPLDEVLADVKSQTGNSLLDYRKKFGQDIEPRLVTLEIKDQEFWPAIDKILDAAKMGLYPFSGEEALAVVEREKGASARSGKAAYAGPLRVEVIGVTAQRDMRMPQRGGLRVKLEIAWEPRLHPIAISQPVESLTVEGDDGSVIAIANTQAVLDVEVQPGSHATELAIPFELPSRDVKSIAKLRGKLVAIVPGRTVEFRFEKLGAAKKDPKVPSKPMEQQRGGVTVVLDRVQRNQDLWEVHMRLRIDSKEAALESHRGWVFQNLTYLLDKQGEVIDHAGFETTMQSEREVGLAYFFELPDDIANYTWVYRTPAAIVRVPVEYELTDIPLP